MITLDTLIAQYQAAQADWQAKHNAWRTAPRRQRQAESVALVAAEKAMGALSRAILVATGYDIDRWQQIIGVKGGKA